jgi:hypothetical protein
VVKKIIDGIDGGEKTLTVPHGGGGTGKSFVVREICEQLQQRGYEVVSTYPTGAGACQLINGRTFHSTLMYIKNGNRLSAQSAAFLSKLFGPNVAFIVVDEISMLKAKFLTLLDERLRMLYRNDRPFGGKSILLVRHTLSGLLIKVHGNSTMFCRPGSSRLCLYATSYMAGWVVNPPTLCRLCGPHIAGILGSCCPRWLGSLVCMNMHLQSETPLQELSSGFAARRAELTEK